jgi:hypothetical protein
LVLNLGALLFFMNRPGRATEPPPAAAEPTVSDQESAVDSSPTPPGSETTTASETPNTVVYPDITISGRECGRDGDGPYAAAAGNINTTSRFAVNVGKAYRQSESNGAPLTLYVYSPSTATRITWIAPETNW